MLEPREADLPALFLAFVVLPLVTYILLGKWSESARKKERISLLAQLAAEEAFRAEAMTTTLHSTVRTSPKIIVHQCARCLAPATTRCSRCKSVRYCSGKCQIIHWRHGHKLECQRLETSSFSVKTLAIEESSHQRVLQTENMNSLIFSNNSKEPMQENSYSNKPHYTSSVAAATKCGTVETSQISTSERKFLEPDSEVTQREETIFLGNCEENIQVMSMGLSSVSPSREASIRQKLGNGDFVALAEEPCRNHSFHERTVPKSSMHESCKLRSKVGNIFMPESNSSTSTLPYPDQSGRNGFAIGTEFISNKGNFLGNKFNSNDDLENPNSERISHKCSAKSKSKVHPLEPHVAASPISGLKKASKEYPFSGKERKGHVADESKIPRTSAGVHVPAPSNNGLYDMEVTHMIGLKKSLEVPRPEATGASNIAHRKLKALFPYEEFMKFFQCEAWDISPRGLQNCGNSCYANAVLQCLTCTKPLNIYLLGRSHSRNCHGKDWCLMCELEQHVMMLREFGGPLSPSRILSHMRTISFQMGGGSQEDAHEFLRLLVTSMQSICLDGVGGEKKVDPRLQETTFIQHTFGGCLRSKVKCLRCNHESERYERIMDLTLEILGWVESLEDALTQFTACEDLDGENMYRCGRCATYVRARKQLRIHEAPNILTIVLKRFQKGSYGKINKCITFPEMLDMIPFMTGTGDSPPLYMLYAVVVHLDTQNASFSGHYVSYVKDLQGTWFRIDDTEVQPVPMSQVMSEGAYILFYSRSYPRTPRANIGKTTTTLQSLASTRHCFSKTQKPTRQEEQKTAREAMDFSDATTSSDWSLFTSSDESSFTTESTRDSFSTVDYSDTFNSTDPIFSIFNTYTPEYPLNGNVSCRSFSHCKPDTRFLSEGKNFVLDSYLSGKPLSNRVQSGKNPNPSRFSILPSA